MIKKNTITPLVLAGIFLLMLGLSFAAVPLYDLFCRVTGFGGTSYNVSPSSFGQYFNKLGCFCFEKQTLKPGEKASYDLVFYLDPELVNDPKTKNIEDVTMSYTFFSSDYYKVEKNES